MPSPRTPQEILSEALEKFGRSAPEKLIRQALRERGHEPGNHLELIREHIAERFAFSLDDKQCWGRYQGHEIDGAEAVRQAVNALAVRIESAESNPATQALTPVEQVAQQLRRHHTYG